MADVITELERPLSEKEVAVLLGVSPNTLKHWRWIGKGPRYVKLVSKIAYRPSDLQRWLADSVIDPGTRSDGR